VGADGFSYTRKDADSAAEGFKLGAQL
jgi:catechol 2,3-dioxygenase